MSGLIYTFRNYCPADTHKFVQLVTEAGMSSLSGGGILTGRPGEILYRPNHSPEKDIFLCEAAGEIVGYLDITPEPVIKRGILHCFMQYHHRRKVLATKLLGLAMNRARELGLKVVQVNVAEDNADARDALLKLGFKSVRRFIHLRLDMSVARWEDADQGNLHCRHLQRGEENALTNIQNRSFTGTWGYNPNTVEEINYCLNLSDCCPDDVLLACIGNRIIGYCWTLIPQRTPGKGQIFMLGVDPDYRGRGAGKSALLAGLSYLRSKGLHTAELTVDSRNKVARALYESLGFNVQASSLWYEKAVD